MIHGASSRGGSALQRELAAALLARPRCTLDELARSAGISRATLYRIAGSREGLTTALLESGYQALEAAAGLLETEPADGRLERATTALMRSWPLVLMTLDQLPESPQRVGSRAGSDEKWAGVEQSFEAFFLAGQRLGGYRLDINAAWITDFYWACFRSVSQSLARRQLAASFAPTYVLELFRHGARLRAVVDPSQRP